MQIDHVVMGVRDLDEAAERLRTDHGLGSVAGGRHPGWGTGNRIVPLGPNYLELLAVVDPAEAAGHPLGRRLSEATAGGDGFLVWCMAAPDLEATAARLELAVEAGSRERPDGSVLRWRSAGLDRALAEPSLPFFIAWEGSEDLHPGRAPADHDVEALGINRVEVGGDAVQLASWLEGGDLAVEAVGGPSGVLAVHISVAGGDELILR